MDLFFKHLGGGVSQDQPFIRSAPEADASAADLKNFRRFISCLLNYVYEIEIVVGRLL